MPDVLLDCALLDIDVQSVHRDGKIRWLAGIRLYFRVRIMAIKSVDALDLILREVEVFHRQNFKIFGLWTNWLKSTKNGVIARVKKYIP